MRTTPPPTTAVVEFVLFVNPKKICELAIEILG